MLAVIDHPLVKLYYHHQATMLLSIDGGYVNKASNVFMAI